MQETPGADWVEELMRSFRDKLVGGMYEGLYALEGEPLRRVMDAQADVLAHRRSSRWPRSPLISISTASWSA